MALFLFFGTFPIKTEEKLKKKVNLESKCIHKQRNDFQRLNEKKCKANDNQMSDKNMFSVFCVFNSNLNELSFRLLLTDCQTIEDLSIDVSNKRVELNMDSKTIAFKFSDCIEFKANSLRQLKAFYSNYGRNEDENRCLQIGFTLSTEMVIRPLKPSIPKTTLPVNSELMNDWIFCHNHSHKQEECAEKQKFEELCHQLNSSTIDDKSDKIQELRPVLSTFEQIIKLLSETNDTKFLFESEDKNFSLILNIFNKEMILTSIRDQIDVNSDFLLIFLNKTSVFYKVFKNCEKEINSELNRYRFAFDVRFFLIEIQVMMTLIKTLIESTKSVLPLDLRFEKDYQLFFGFI